MEYLSAVANYIRQWRDFARDSLNPAVADSHGDQRFNELAKTLFDLQYQHNVPFRNWCDRQGVRPGNWRSWQDTPAIPTMAFKEFAVSCIPPAHRSHVFHTSGTTAAQAGRHYHHADTLALYEESARLWFQPHLVPGGGPRRIISLSPPAQQVPHSSLAHMLDHVQRQYGDADSGFVGCLEADGHWQIDFSRAHEAFHCAVSSRNPVLVLGTAFSYVQLLDEARARHLTWPLPPGSQAMETGGYKGRSRTMTQAELYAMIRQGLHLPFRNIIAEYGMCELSSQAYAGATPLSENEPVFQTNLAIGLNRRFRFPPWARVRLISPEHGREPSPEYPGLLEVCDLANAGSVMMIQTEDLAVCDANGFRLIGRATQAEPRGCSLQI